MFIKFKVFVTNCNGFLENEIIIEGKICKKVRSLDLISKVLTMCTGQEVYNLSSLNGIPLKRFS